MQRDITYIVFRLGYLCVLPLLAGAAPSTTFSNPDFTKSQARPEGATHDWNLGPTGMRGWMYSNKMETSEARQILITSVDSLSPADQLIMEGDVILGVAKKRFSYDPRTEFGKAITQAEASDGVLHLTRWREGNIKEVSVELPALGPYSQTAPFKCKKSSHIVRQGCRTIAKKLEENPDQGNPIERSLNALALLASGDKTYWPLVRYQASWASQFSDPERRTLHSWHYGPINMLLAEYTMVTGDTQFLPDLTRITMEIVHGQSLVGSWGHRFTQENGRLAGYGMMNAPGLPLTVSLILARKAGVQEPSLDTAISKSAQLIHFYVGKGSVPYGDHHPWIETHDDNGKNGIAAILFNLLHDHDAVEYFSHMSVASHGAERDLGHTGNFFNMLWAMPGVALSGPHASGAWLDEFGWYYDLARRWDGSFRHQGPPGERPDRYNKWDCTGAYLLAFAQPIRATHLTGRATSAARQIDRQKAQSLIEDGRGWSPRLKKKTYSDRSIKDLVDGLSNWSPVVRERSGMELARRKDDVTPLLIQLLTQDDLFGKIGACQAVIHLQERGSAAIPALRTNLSAKHLWLRIKAAEALARCGKQSMPLVPQLLHMMTDADTANDPRGMQQRYLCFALFNNRDGLLGRSLEGVDRDALFAAVKAGLHNEDGRARKNLTSVYKNLSYDEIEPLLPAIYKAVVEPAPSGIMFADGVRLTGLEILAKHHIKEGIPLCMNLIDVERWGSKKRVKRCLDAMRLYGAAAQPNLPALRQLEAKLGEKGWTADKIDALHIASLIHDIETADNPPVQKSIHLNKVSYQLHPTKTTP